jgi:RNA polymerase sigma-70 factor (ECF subfamily)
VVPADDDRAAVLWDQQADAVYAYARRRVGATAAPDVVADVFAVVVAHPERVPEDALPWLYRTAWNVIANLRRADARSSSIGFEAPSVADPGSVVAERSALTAALAELSDADREAILLTAWEGLDAKRAAAAAGCSAGTFAVRLHRARRRLERALAIAEEVG